MSFIVAHVVANGIVFAADGATYDIETGELMGPIHKLFALPHLNAIIGNVGIGGFGHVLQMAIGSDFSTFDGLCDGFVDACQRAKLMMSQGKLWPAEARATAILGGWSETRQAYELYKVHSSPKEAIEADGTLVTHEKWKLHKVEGQWMSTAPSEEEMRQCGLLTDEEMPVFDGVARLACAARLHSGIDIEGRYGVGCFLQMAVLQNTNITSWIAHRWPDKLGEPIDPSCGELLPSFPIQMP